MRHDDIASATGDPMANDRARQEMWVFTALFWASAIVPFGLQVAEHGMSARLVVSAAILIGLGLWIHGVYGVQRNARITPGRGAVMLVGLYVALAVLLSISEAYFLLLFGVYSVTFGYSGTFKRGLMLSLIPTLIWSVWWVLYGLPVGAVLTPFFVWVTSNLVSYFTYQVATQSQERGRLLDEIARTRDDLAAAERQRGMLEERARVAGEIHDTLAQGFTSIVLLSKGTSARLADLGEEAVAHNLGLIEQTARENLAEARRLVEALRPAMLDDLSLRDAIDRLAARHRAETGSDVEVEVTGEPRPLGGSEDVLLLRAAQEALSNTRKHAQASVVRVQLGFEQDQASISVEDNGNGFDPADAPKPVAGGTGGQGLAILRERVSAIAGELELISAPGQGSTLTVRIPTAQVPLIPEPA